MRTAKGDRRYDCRMPEQNLVHFVRGNVFAAADDDVFDPAGQMQIAVRIQKSLIAGTKPSIHEGARVGFGIIFVSAKYIRSLNRDLAPLTGSKMVAVFVHDADAEAGAHANRGRFAGAWWQGIRGYLVSGFGHAVSLDERHAKHALDLIDEFLR